MRDVTGRIHRDVVIGAAFLVIGVLLTLANMDVFVFRKIANLIWPLTLIATGLYGLSLRGWREKERKQNEELQPQR